jgi:hypothetical protein
MGRSQLFLLPLFLFSATAWAEQNVPVNIPGGGAADLLNVTNIPTALDGQVEEPGQRFTCTDSYGRALHRGDALFDDCMKQKRTAGAPKASPSPSATPQATKN